MWKCVWCGCEFEEPKTIRDGFITKEVCPECNEDEFEDCADLEECVCCGEHFAEVDGTGLCRPCASDMYEIYDEAVLKVMDLMREDADYIAARELFKSFLQDLWEV